MAYTILELQTDLSGIIHGTNLDKIQGFLPLVNRAARQVLLDVDPRETKRISSTANVFYDQVYNYPVDNDLKGDKIIDIRPQVNRQAVDKPLKTYNQGFDEFKENNFFTIEENNGVKYLRYAKTLFPPPSLLNAMNGITDNGTWSIGGNAINLRIDTFNYLTSNASLYFDISGGGTTAYIENSTNTAVDLSLQSGIGSLFVWVFIPSTTIISDVFLRWGSSNTDYYTQTITTPHFGSFRYGWNLCRFDWNTATTVGTPDDTAINYLRVGVTYNGTAVQGVRVDNIVSTVGTLFEIEYYSKYLFKDVDGVSKEKATEDTDTINLDTDSFNLFFKKCAEFCIQQVKKQSSDLKYFKDDYDKDLKRYKSQYRSEALRQQLTYYTIPSNRVVRKLP